MLYSFSIYSNIIILLLKKYKAMIPKPNSSITNSKKLNDKYNQVRILKNCILTNNNGGPIDFLYGYALGNLDITRYEKVIMNLRKQFDSIKELVQIYQHLTCDDVVVLVCELIEEIKKITKSENTKRMEQLPALLNINLSEMVNNRRFILQKWERQARLQAQAQLNQQYILKILQEEQNQQRKKAQEKESEGWECQICVAMIQPDSMGILECGHIFHPQCLNGFLKAQIESNNVNIVCPMQGCNRKMQVNDILNYIDGELREKYEKFSFNKFIEGNVSNFSWCPTAGCSAVFEFDEALNNYRCPSCKKHYCLKCRCLYHVGMTCAEYRVNNSFDPNDQKFINFVKGAKFKQCPKCRYWVQRNQGCPTMNCKCGQKFCYTCGGVGCPNGSCSNSGGAKGIGFLAKLFG